MSSAIARLISQIQILTFMMFEVRPADIRDIGRLDRLLTRRQVQGLIMQVTGGLAWVVLSGDRVRALMGWFSNGDGTGEIWLVPAAGVRGSKEAAGLMRFLKRMLKVMIPADMPTFATVGASNPTGARLVLFLGFELMRPASPFQASYRFYRKRC